MVCSFLNVNSFFFLVSVYNIVYVSISSNVMGQRSKIFPFSIDYYYLNVYFLDLYVILAP